MTTTTTCPDWCTSVGRFHDSTNAQTDERSEMTISIDATCALLTIDQAQQFAAALHKAITWARETSKLDTAPAGHSSSSSGSIHSDRSAA